jgi:chromosome transmission fidelity protein 1
VGLNLRGAIVVVDEAHNLASAVAQSNGASISSALLEHARSQAQAYLKKYRSRLSGPNVIECSRLVSVVTALCRLTDRALQGLPLSEKTTPESAPKSSTDVSRDIKEAKPPKGWMISPSELCIASRIEHINLHALLRWADDTGLARKLRGFVDSSEGGVQGAASAMQSTLGLLWALTKEESDGRVLVVPDWSTKQMTIKYSVISPARSVAALFRDARAVLLTGGTMPPVTELQAELFPKVDPSRVQTFSCGHVVGAEGLHGVIVGSGKLGSTFDFSLRARSGAAGETMMRDLGESVLELVCLAPHGMVVFFPSYALESSLVGDSGTWRTAGVLGRIASHKRVFREPKDASQLEKVLNEFAEAARTEEGAILFAVMGGKLSEGLNFKDDLARLVMVIGMPYPNKADPELHERMKQMDVAHGSGSGARLYESLCMQAVNQSIGRAIRHRHDWAEIVLVDSRYRTARVRSKLPRWLDPFLEAPSTFDQARTSVRRFFDRKRS